MWLIVRLALMERVIPKVQPGAKAKPPTLLRTGHLTAAADLGVQQQHSARLATADADLPSLSDGHLVADATSSRKARGTGV